MKLERFFTLASILALCAVVSAGCVATIGNRDPLPPTNATIGQQLIDLKKAQDSGALSPTEYEMQRARLLERKW